LAGKKAAGNPKRQERMTACWQRSRARANARRRTQEEAARRNLATIRAGGMTPWMAARAERLARRAALRMPAPRTA